MQVAAAVAQLDVLMSLAKAALASSEHGPMCRPTVTYEHPSGAADKPFFLAKALRHVTQIRLSQAGAFVPNSVDLGADDAPFMLLTGPNTGGKSTLMRQARPSRRHLLTSPPGCAGNASGMAHKIAGSSTTFVHPVLCIVT
jgi:DNA mismatch repair ATPase MutS